MSQAETSIKLGSLLADHLKVLGCPLELDVPWDFEKFQVGVAWIEEEVIRLLASRNREWLYKVEDKKEWSKSLFEYCKKLDIVFAPTAPIFSIRDLASIYRRLVSRGIEETYMDKMKGFESLGKTTGDDETEEVDPRVHDFVITVLETDKLPKPTPKQALDVIHSRLVPNMKATGGDPSKFSDDKLLRLCATKNLTDLRFHTDKVITALQMITADPKTDHRLGKVGI